MSSVSFDSLSINGVIGLIHAIVESLEPFTSFTIFGFGQDFMNSLVTSRDDLPSF